MNVTYFPDFSPALLNKINIFHVFVIYKNYK